MTAYPEQADDVRRALVAAGLTKADDSAGTRSRYATDASIYRVAPLAVAWPRSTDDIAAALDVARTFDVGLTVRGAGTSIAGNAIGEGIVLDVSRHLSAITDFDPEAGTARVQPGVVHQSLQSLVMPAGWRLGPDPSTHTRCTIGGMIGNNACGSRALGYGRTADVTTALTVMLSDGNEVSFGQGSSGPTGPRARIEQRLRDLIEPNLTHVRQRYGTFTRQVSGYSLEHLLPENGHDLAKLLVGSEGTLGIVTEATVQLARNPTATGLLALGFGDSVEAASAVPQIIEHHPITCEGMDRRLADLYAAHYGTSAVPELPAGDAWLFVEFAGESAEHCAAKAASLREALGPVSSRFTANADEQRALWKLREAGAGIAGRGSEGRPAYAGWEDSAVPPRALAGYLGELEALIAEHGYLAVPYGHYGEGCVHMRVTFDFGEPGADRQYLTFMEEAAQLVSAHGGSLSGEHGDGRARSSLLRHMYSPRDLELFADVKGIFDPAGILNRGILTDPAPTQADIRNPTAAVWLPQPRRRFEDAGSLTAAAHRCTGVGSCRVTPLRAGTAMCPSYQASLEEEHTTRGRARVLQDATEGHLGREALASDAVADALDLCLACKACARDCPAGVDMAALKSEALWQRYRGKLRPTAHYTVGRLADAVRLLRGMPGGDQLLAVGSAVLNHPVRRRMIAPFLRFAGLHPERTVLPFARRNATSRGDELGSLAGVGAVRGDGDDVVLLLDTFTDNFLPSVADDTAAVLRRCGYRVHVVQQQGCCGLPLISTGQLDAASKRIGGLVGQLGPYVEAGAKILAAEPSCLAALRDEATELVNDERLDAAKHVAAATCTFAEAVLPRVAHLPRLDGIDVVAQPHCHQRAVFGWQADHDVLTALGARVTEVPGCCGMAGNFGAEAEHFDFSLRVAATNLSPGLGDNPSAIVLADGFSCRTQLAQVAPHRAATHLATLLRGDPSAG